MGSQAAKSRDPEGFIRLGEGIWLIKPIEDGKIDKSHPTLILLFGWMDAKLPHVAKFSQGYRKLYPNTPQILVASTGTMLVRPQSRSVQKIQPVLDQLALFKVLGPNAIPHRILTHAFSNGGCTRLQHLSLLLASSPLSKTIITNQPALVILDSAPGGDNWKSAAKVFETTIPSPFIRYPFWILLMTFHFLRVLFGRSYWRFFEGLRLSMLNPRWLPWITPALTSSRLATPYLFIYSKADQLVPYGDISSFTDRAEKSGILVKREIYGDSGHVSHMRSDPSRYWSAITKVWNEVNGIEGA